MEIPNKIQDMKTITKSGMEVWKAFAKYNLIDDSQLLDSTWQDVLTMFASWNNNPEEKMKRSFLDKFMDRSRFEKFLESSEKYNRELRTNNSGITKYTNDLEDLKIMAAKYSKATIKETSNGFDLEKMISL